MRFNKSDKFTKAQVGQKQGPRLIYSGMLLALILFFTGLLGFRSSDKGAIELNRVDAGEVADLSYLSSREVKATLAHFGQQNLVEFGASLSEKDPFWLFQDGKGKLVSLLFFKEFPEPFIGLIGYTDSNKVPDPELMKQADALGPKLYQVVKAADLNQETEVSEKGLQQLAQIYKQKNSIEVNTSIVLKRVVGVNGEGSVVSLKNTQSPITSIVLIGAGLSSFILISIYQVFFRSKKRRLARQFGAALVEMGLLIALIAIICVTAVQGAGKQTNCNLLKSSQAFNENLGGMMSSETAAACCPFGVLCSASIPPFCMCFG